MVFNNVHAMTGRSSWQALWMRMEAAAETDRLSTSLHSYDGGGGEEEKKRWCERKGRRWCEEIVRLEA